MSLSRPFPVDKAYPNALDVRQGQATLFPREGVLPDRGTTGSGVAVAGAGWAVSAREFCAVVRRGNGPYAISYGAALVANNAVELAAWTLPGAPSSGSTTSLLWIRATDPSRGESLVQVPGEVGPDGLARTRAVPIFGITTGTTAVAPILPAGALLIATATIAAGATSAATSVIVQSPLFGSVNGGTLYVRQASALTPALAAGGIPGELAYALDTQATYEIRLSGTTQRWARKGGGTLHFVRTALQGIDVGVLTTIAVNAIASDSDRADFGSLAGGSIVLVEGDYVVQATATLETRPTNGARTFLEIQFADGTIITRGNSWVEEKVSAGSSFRVGPAGASIRFRVLQSNVSPGQGVSLDGYLVKVS